MPPDEQPKTRWLAPSIQVQWGPYFRPDPEEQKKIVDMALAAVGAAGGSALVTRRTAIQKVASIFGIDNVDAAIVALEKEDEQRAKKAAELAKQTDAAEPKPTEPKQPAGDQP